MMMMGAMVVSSNDKDGHADGDDTGGCGNGGRS